MSISEERQLQFAKVVIDGVWNDDLTDYSDDDQALVLARRAIAKFVQAEVDVDQSVRDKIQSLKRGVNEGTPEWDVLFKKYYEEEVKKRG
ncbi:MAG: DUF507 family protein [Bdellovibrionales bacterium]|nr:DUF507 family protein [Bdellovibrionales bacterium]